MIVDVDKVTYVLYYLSFFHIILYYILDILLLFLVINCTNYLFSMILPNYLVLFI